jgi:8-amino-7-oxononanoate synthase
MRLLQKRFAKYNVPQVAMKMGLYSFYHPIETGQDTEVILKGKKTLMFGSNSYLGLTNHPEIIKAAKKALDKYGTGASGSRLMNGNLDLHEELESKLAEFVNKPAATVFSTGFQVNVGTIPSLMGRNDLIVIDEKSHASIIEGCRLAFAKTLKYKHNDMGSLEKILQKSNKNQTTLIITDGIFSMDGDIAKLDKICELADKYSASVMVDDAHALGVIGEHGSGTASYYNLTDKTDLIMGTFSKSFASLGGFVAGDFETLNYIRHNARSLLFSAGIPPASAATVLKALEIIKNEPERIEMLWENTNYASQCLVQEGFFIGESVTPIIPIFIGEEIKTYQYATMLLENGVYVNPIVHPGVDKGKAILRFSLMTTHTKKQIDIAIDKFVTCRKLIED